MKQFTIVETGTNTKTVIETEATTVGELLNALDEKDINYEGMTLFEGISQSEFSVNRPDAILPHDLPWKGGVTNNLVILLTAERKKISSGMDRKELYAIVKNHELEEHIKEVFSKNYTNVSSDELFTYLDQNGYIGGGNGGDAAPENKEEHPCGGKVCMLPVVMAMLMGLEANGVLTLKCVYDAIGDALGIAPSETAAQKAETELPGEFTEEDIDAMLHHSMD